MAEQARRPGEGTVSASDRHANLRLPARRAMDARLFAITSIGYVPSGMVRRSMARIDQSIRTPPWISCSHVGRASNAARSSSAHGRLK